MPGISKKKDQKSMSTSNKIRSRRVLLIWMVVLLLVLSGLVFSSRGNNLVNLARAQVYNNAYPMASPPDVVSDQEELATNTPTLTGDSDIQAVLSVDTPTVSPTGNESKLPHSGNGLSVGKAITQGTIVLSVEEDGYYHLVAYNPQTLPYMRITVGPWNDITPATSPDGKSLAFSSNRSGQWDLYRMDLATGEVSRLTHTPEFDASPSWSPDGQWIVYESYVSEILAPEKTGEGNSTPTPALTPTAPPRRESLELFILPIAGEASEQKPIRLTSDPAADYSPTWSPAGRQIAFVSNRSGDDEIWLADLDRIDDRFQNLSRNSHSQDRAPKWSPDGSSLVWSTTADGFQDIHIERFPEGIPAPRIGSGEQIAWSPSGDAIIAILSTPNQVYLTGYDLQSAGLTLPPLELTGPVNGITWTAIELHNLLPEAFQQAAEVTLSPIWQAALTPVGDVPNGRQRVVEVEDLEAPYPLLNDMVDESFQALRDKLGDLAGWDYLSTLENAFVPLTSPMYPGLLGDWLFSGRAIAVNTLPMNAGWLVVVREDFGSETFWRVYLRTRFQDGTQGLPLHYLPWNFNARNSGDPRYYEQGGALATQVPTGYWLDLTQLAASYGWERLPALITWRSAFGAARFNEFIFSDGRDWQAAMQEIYPVEALSTPTPIQPPTFTPTSTRRPTRTPTPTRTPRPTYTPTFTRTPYTTNTPTLTVNVNPSTP